MNPMHNAWIKSVMHRTANAVAIKSQTRCGTSPRGNKTLTLLEPLEDRCLFSSILGTAGGYAALGGSTVTNTGATAIFGNVGVSPGSAITGFPPGTISGGAIEANNGSAVQAESDLATAYGAIAGEASIPANNLTGQDLGGMTLAPGVYHFNTAAQLTGTLTLDAQGNPNARFDFQIGTTLTTASNSAINIINGGIADNVYFQVGSSATLGTSTAFEGSILAHQSVTLNTNATLAPGRALAEVGAVTMDTNQLVATEADVSLTATTPGSTVVAGNTISYSITVANTGPNTAQTLAFTDLLPAHTTFVSDVQTSGPVFVLTNPAIGGTGSISGTSQTLASNGAATFTVVARVLSDTPSGASVVNSPAVTTATFDPNLANNTQTLTTSVLTQADVSLTNSTASSTVLAGNSISYTITLADTGPSDAQTVDLSDLIPANTTFVSASQTSGLAFNLTTPAAGGTGTISGTVATLVSGASASFNVVVLVSPGTPVGTSIVNAPGVTLATTDPNLVNNTQSVTTTVRAPAPAVTSVNPVQGITAGGTLVTIAGTNLENATEVEFGTIAVTNFASDSATQIVLLSPAGAIGAVDVTVITPGGTSVTSLSDRFTYVAAPVITSLATSAFTAGSPGTFVFTTTGSPTPALSSSALPAGLSFVDNLNGTATLSGTLALGSYPLTITATNGISPDSTQSFTLSVQTIAVNPTLTNLTVSAPANNVDQGRTLQFTAAGTNASGLSVPLGVVTWSLDSGSSGSIDQNGLYTADNVGGTAGPVTVRATTAGETATQSITVNAVAPGTQTTQVVSVQPIETASAITGFVVTFNGPLDATAAQNVRGYRILRQNIGRRSRNFWEQLLGKNSGVQTVSTPYKTASAVYDAQSNSVTLTLASPMTAKKGTMLVDVLGTGVHAVLDANGRAIDGDANGRAGGNYAYRFSMALGKSVSYKTNIGQTVKLSLTGPGEILAVIPSGTTAPIVDLMDTDSVATILTGKILKGHSSVAYAVLDELNGTADADIELGSEFHVNKNNATLAL